MPKTENGKDSTENVLEAVATLVDTWCERRCLTLLRLILKGYPLSSGLTDEWSDLLEALEDVRAFGRDELTEKETQIVNELIGSINKIVHRK